MPVRKLARQPTSTTAASEIRPLYSRDAEEAVLSAMLADGAARNEVVGILKEDDFFDERHRRIFRGVLELPSGVVDPILLAEHLERASELERVGGRDYIGYLLDVVPTTANAAHHAGIVRARAKQRTLIEHYGAAQQLAREGRLTAEEIVRHSAAVLRGIVDNPDARLALYDESDLAALPQPTQLIDGILPANALAVMVGEKGSLKTFLALDIAAHIANGLAWHGRETRRGTVIYAWGEGRLGIGPRVEAWTRYHRAESSGVLFLPHRLNLNDPADCDSFVATVERRLGVREGVALIVIDTLNRYSIGNENTSEDMSAFVRGCDALREATGATVLTVHHKGHADADRGRGSSVLDAAADTVIFVSRDDDRITVDCKKQKDGPEFETLGLEIVQSPPSLALKSSGVADGELRGQRLVLLRALHQNSTENGASYKSWLEVAGIGASSFNKARSWLQARGYVLPAGGKWRLTESGLIAIHSTDSTVAPLPHSGVSSKPLHRAGDSLRVPAVEQDRLSATA